MVETIIYLSVCSGFFAAQCPAAESINSASAGSCSKTSLYRMNMTRGFSVLHITFPFAMLFL